MYWKNVSYHFPRGRREQTTGQKFHKIYYNILKYLNLSLYLEAPREMPNMPGIGSLIREIDVNIQKVEKSKNTFAQ